MPVREASQSGTQYEQSEAGSSGGNVDRKTNVFGTEGVATDYFVAPGYRPGQREIIEEIEAAYEQGYRYVILEGPTGIGKSHVVRSFAFMAGNAHILTVQKLLQDQYQRDFTDMFVMKGRSAYTCLKGEMGETCANGPCQLKKSVSCDNCPYKEAKQLAAMSAVTVHNFDSFFYQNSFSAGFPGRNLLVVDEAHNIPNKFSSFFSFTIDSRGGEAVPEYRNIREYDDFVAATVADYEIEYDSLQMLYHAGGLTSNKEVTHINELGNAIHRMKRYLDERKRDVPIEFVFDYREGGKFGPSVTFRPVFVGKFVSWLFGYGERVLLVSATILDKEMYCMEIGLNPDEVYFVQAESTFPAKNRPILKKYAGSMSYKDINDTLPKIAEYVQEIADKYPGKKGIVQTHSEKIDSYLRGALYDRRFTFNKNYPRPQDMLEAHKRKEGSIIVASGLREGLDLAGDLSQIQIFCKIPYPSMGDKVVKRKMELSPDWYGWITTVNLVQALGRSIRSPKDKAVTYILDPGFGWFYKRNKKFIPNYIKESIRW
jgi:ATP-dependent DNA helicase DinG